MKWKSYGKKPFKEPKTPRNDYERKLVRRPCIELLRSMRNKNQLKRYPFMTWSCPPDQGKLTPQQRKAAKLDGYEKGVFDLTIIAANETEQRVWLIEFKYDKGKYTTEQKALAEACNNTPVQALIIKTVDEFEIFLRENLK